MHTLGATLVLQHTASSLKGVTTCRLIACNTPNGACKHGRVTLVHCRVKRNRSNRGNKSRMYGLLTLLRDGCRIRKAGTGAAEARRPRCVGC